MMNKKGADSLTQNLTKILVDGEDAFVNRVWDRRAKEIDQMLGGKSDEAGSTFAGFMPEA
jgi:hypothetical protein